MRMFGKTFILFLCLTVLVMFSGLAQAEGDIDKKYDSKACVKGDTRPECQAHKETAEVKTASAEHKECEHHKVEAEEVSAEHKDCPYHKAEVETAAADKKECPYHKAEVETASADKKDCPPHKTEVKTASVSEHKECTHGKETVKTAAVKSEKHEEGESCTKGVKTNCIETFHEAMAPPCHEYIPQGKYKEARAAVPAMVKASKEIADYYPGCTYGKNINEKFEARREVFLKRVAEMEEAAKGDDDKAFKLAFDKMHSAFAEMNGVLYMRPEGVEEFHNVLAQIWHDYLPNEKYEEIEGSLPELIKKAEYLTTVKLDETMADKQEAFTQQAEKLLKCAKDLHKACKSDDKEKIASTTETMHKSYESLTATF